MASPKRPSMLATTYEELEARVYYLVDLLGAARPVTRAYLAERLMSEGFIKWPSRGKQLVGRRRAAERAARRALASLRRKGQVVPAVRRWVLAPGIIPRHVLRLARAILLPPGGLWRPPPEVVQAVVDAAQADIVIKSMFDGLFLRKDEVSDGKHQAD